ncbi:MAG: response regulator [Deltaproteobacteria bacterium]|nr:response regulator [Deltaproteobacteria bacterium]
MKSDSDRASGYHILVVDDEDDVLEMMAAFLMAFFPEAHLTRSGNGADAIQHCKSRRFDLICTDQKMPYLTGSELINGLRSDPDNPNQNTPVLFVSAFVHEVKEKIKFQNNIFYLKKPFDTNNLTLIVDKIMIENTINILGENFVLKEWQKKFHEKQGELLFRTKIDTYNEFSVSLAHELNNPLAVIEGAAYLIRKQADPEHLNRYTEQILHNIERMRKLIQHLQKFSVISKGNLREPVLIGGAIRDSLVFFQRRLRDRNICPDVKMPEDRLYIRANEGLLTKIFHALIMNSIEAFDRNQTPVDDRFILVSCRADADQNLVVVFEDNAGGIPAEIKPKIFEPFVSSKAEAHGVGLGLAVTYSTLCRMGGSIRVRSEGDGRSAFFLTFPMDLLLTREEAGELSLRESESKAGHQKIGPHDRKRILVVDDEEGICDLLENYLMDVFDVDTTVEPEVAERMVASCHYDMVISDFKMTTKDGIHMMNNILLICPDMKFILMSGHITETESLGFCGSKEQLGFLSKPFGTPSSLIQYVHRFFGEA